MRKRKCTFFDKADIRYITGTFAFIVSCIVLSCTLSRQQPLPPVTLTEDTKKFASGLTIDVAEEIKECTDCMMHVTIVNNKLTIEFPTENK